MELKNILKQEVDWNMQKTANLNFEYMSFSRFSTLKVI